MNNNNKKKTSKWRFKALFFLLRLILIKMSTAKHIGYLIK